MKYVKTQFGAIPIDSLPVVEDEPVQYVLLKCVVFYSIVVLILLLFVASNKNKVIVIKKEKSDKTTIRLDSLSVYNPNNPIKLENIILIDTSNNLINIDITQNKFVKIYKKFNGLMYTIDLEQEIEIKEIGFISDINEFITYINVDAYLNGKQTWNFCNHLKNTRENFIKLY